MERRFSDDDDSTKTRLKGARRASLNHDEGDGEAYDYYSEEKL